MKPAKNVCVVVLGDIGRSPRMQYHALSLAEHGCKVDIVGYGDSEPSKTVKLTPLIRYHYLIPYPALPLPRLLNYIFKTLWQSLTLLFVLLMNNTPDSIIVQNPPAVPSLLVCWLYACLTKARLVIDWHNYAHTIMALSVGPQNLLVKLTKQIERLIGKRAGTNFCVTNAMRKDLDENWSIKAVTLYDRPPEKFRTLSLEEKHDIWCKLGATYKELLGEDGNTVFTTSDESGNIKWRSKRPGLLLSSTSWTEDEDFSILFQALQEYEDTVDTEPGLSPLICIITGKGPLKEYYCKKIELCKWKHVQVITPWLDSEDYPKVLGSADLGVSLHTSSSGLDLPMKVVDMFGCGLPVCAYDFNCLNELVRHGENGFTFKNSTELSRQLIDWFRDDTKRKTFTKELEKFQAVRWKQNWDNVALPYFNYQ
ncbi:hypothetical protein PPYR_10178 [Photinus pyralis]|uniref:Beta-1,4-mannosyltransferase n=1 Tax=Photinus pyralis TaxID=7054 RepID=A0A1Y1NBQ8_PHOPY|nr:chitobiosyldiphosphodolichol beta-mannosyltransferase [Photinus pyralis]KAB0796117.1 hypothetical protein PPYR_10178 [Photinus pyralis]